MGRFRAPCKHPLLGPNLRAAGGREQMPARYPDVRQVRATPSIDGGLLRRKRRPSISRALAEG
jgi:hypothetical protein